MFFLECSTQATHFLVVSDVLLRRPVFPQKTVHSSVAVSTLKTCRLRGTSENLSSQRHIRKPWSQRHIWNPCWARSLLCMLLVSSCFSCFRKLLPSADNSLTFTVVIFVRGSPFLPPSRPASRFLFLVFAWHPEANALWFPSGPNKILSRTAASMHTYLFRCGNWLICIAC